MKIEFIPKFVTLLAGAIVCIITIVQDMDVTYSLELLLATLIIFYLIGTIAKKIIQKVMEGNMFVKNVSKEQEEKDNASKEDEDKNNKKDSAKGQEAATAE